MKVGNYLYERESVQYNYSQVFKFHQMLINIFLTRIIIYIGIQQCKVIEIISIIIGTII